MISCYDIAAKMLGVPVQELPITLKLRLEKIQELIRIIKPNGSLNSTQVIASVVEEYLRDEASVYG